MNITKNVFIKAITVLLIAVIMLFVIKPYSIGRVNTSEINISDGPKHEVEEAGGILLGIIEVAGMIISVVALMIIGIRYMTSSVQEQADMKQYLPYYLIGAVLLFGLSIFLKDIYILISSALGTA